MNKMSLILGTISVLTLGAYGTVEVIKANETEPQYSAIIFEEQAQEPVVDEVGIEIVPKVEQLEEIEPVEPVAIEPIESEPCKALRVYGTTDKWELFRLLGEDTSYDWHPFLAQVYRKFWNMIYFGHSSATKGDYSFESFWNKNDATYEAWQLRVIYNVHIEPLLEGC